ncbi:MAG TPA: hypothetical protein VK453_18530 [Micromonosporaceae bacterium]|nr:hypothetical protein [Micromonosporaceae bacterium]
MEQKRRTTARPLRALRKARRSGHLVRISRDWPDADRIDGFVLAVSRTWTLVALLGPTVMLDGFAAVRTGDVVRVRRRAGREDFPVSVLAVRGQWPPRPPFDVVLASASTIIAGAADLFPLVRIHTETVDLPASVIGRSVRCTRRKVRLREITRRGRWRRRTTTLPMAAVTRIEFGRRVDQALIEYAGLPD